MSSDYDIKLPSLEEIKDALARSEEQREKRLAKARELAADRDEPSGAYCPVCDGQIMDRRRNPPMHFDWNTPFGRRHEDREPSPAPHEGYHCADCGLEFYQLPKRPRKRRR